MTILILDYRPPLDHVPVDPRRRSCWLCAAIITIAVVSVAALVWWAG